MSRHAGLRRTAKLQEMMGSMTQVLPVPDRKPHRCRRHFDIELSRDWTSGKAKLCHKARPFAVSHGTLIRG